MLKISKRKQTSLAIKPGCAWRKQTCRAEEPCCAGCACDIKVKVAEVLQENNVGEFVIYLFGSRGRGEARFDSDYDIMVVTQRDFDGREKFNLLRRIRKNIKYLGLAIDVVIKSTKEYEEEREQFGSFVHSIQNEIVAI